MQRLGSVFSKFIERILTTEERIPSDIAAVDVGSLALENPDIALENWRIARLNAKGATSTTRLKLTKVFRTTTFLGTDPGKFQPRPDQALSFESLLYHPDEGYIEVYGMLPSGTPYDKELADRHIRRSILEQKPEVKNLYKLVETASVKANWYVNSWERY